MIAYYKIELKLDAPLESLKQVDGAKIWKKVTDDGSFVDSELVNNKQQLDLYLEEKISESNDMLQVLKNVDDLNPFKNSDFSDIFIPPADDVKITNIEFILWGLVRDV